MLVTIISVFYNREKLVEDTIGCLLNQTHDEIEIIAVDDGSKDNTVEALRAIKDSRLKIITHENWGFTKSVKHAVENSNAEIVAIHGSGDYAYPSRIEKQLDLLLSDERLGAVGCYLENVNTKSEEKSIRYIKLDSEKDQTEDMLNRSFFTHGEVMFRKKYYEMSGGYREFFTFAQDRDLWLRMSLFAKFDVVKEVLYRRYNLTDGVSGSYEKSLVQSYFSEMAIQSLKMRLNTGSDYIDKFGDNAKFFLEKNKTLSKKTAVLGMRAFRENDLKASKDLLKRSRNTKLTFFNVGLSILPIVASLDNRVYTFMLRMLSFLKKKKNQSAKKN